MQNKLPTYPMGIVVIGRNEGARLRRALSSIPRGIGTALYVDSGSSDSSIALAKSLGFSVHELDPSRPFSAARARREGAEILLQEIPDLQFIQFLDGDCALVDGWMEIATAHLCEHKETAIVCGLLSEAAPERSVYNRIIAVRWNASTGPIDACGGIFMIRASVYTQAGGFNPALMTGEEAELCARVRKAGYRIDRLDTGMASHDAAIVTFAQWWGRAVWGGFGDAMEYDVLQGKVSDTRRKETRSIWIWVVAGPLIGLAGLVGAFWWSGMLLLPALCALGYSALVGRIAMDRIRRGDSLGEAIPYSGFCVLRKFPYAIGFFKYRLWPASRAKVPDPHAPERGGHEQKAG